jgi:hypothetical protein
MDQRRCVNCRARFTRSRNPHQRYCSNPICQKKRRCKYQKQRLNRDPDYRANQRALERSWHSKHKDYWQNYRKNHPEQVERNRLNQKNRDQKRRQKLLFGEPPLLATMYAFNSKNIYLSNSYNEILCRIGMLATIGRYSQGSYDLLVLPHEHI